MKKLLLVLITCLGAAWPVLAGDGQCLYEQFPTQTGGADSMLLADSSEADHSELLTASIWDGPDRDSYRMRITMWLTPNTTGDYQFRIASDDDGRLWLGAANDINPANAVQIAGYNGWTNLNEWGKYASQTSGIISLEAGNIYFLRGGVLEGGGGDHIHIQWKGPGFDWQDISGPQMSSVLPFALEVEWGGEKLVEYEVWGLANTGDGATSGLAAEPYGGYPAPMLPLLDLILQTEGAADFTGYLPRFTLDGMELPSPDDYFVTRTRGIMKIDEAVLLGLAAQSDDNHLIFVGDWWDPEAELTLVAQDDINHGTRWRDSGVVDATPGYLGLEVWQYEHGGGQGLRVVSFTADQPLTDLGPQNLVSRVQASIPVPANGSIGVPTDQVLSWEAPFGLADPQFRVKVWEQGQAEPAGVTTTETTYDPDLSENTAYWWQVDVQDPNEGGNPVWLAGKKWAFHTVIPAGPDIMITSEPGDQLVDPGSEVTLAVTAESAVTPLSYQWKKDGTEISGATDATLVIAGFTKADNGVYTCEVTNGQATAESSGATIAAKELMAYWPLDGDLDDHAKELDPTADGDKDATYMVNDPNTLDDDVPDMTVPYIAGKVGQAVLFNGTDNFAYAGTWNPSELTNQLTVSLWANYSGDAGHWEGLIGKRDSWASDNMMWQVEQDNGTDVLKTLQSNGGGGGAYTVKLPVAGGTKVSVGGRVLYSDQHPTNADERAYRAFDGLYNTKWLAFQNTGWLTYIFPGERAYVVTSYAITSGNDAPDRDPDDWTLQGSNDGVNWDILDTQTGQAAGWTARNETRTFDLSSNTTAYKMYKLDVTKIRNPGANIIQISEVELFADEALDDTWVNVVATYDGATARTYINGWFVREAGMNLDSDTEASVVFGGCEADPAGGPAEGSKPWGGNLYNGALDEIMIYNYALSATEVLKAYMAVEGGQDYCLDGTQPALDFDGNCVVDTADLLMLLSEWLQNNLAQ